jgi:molybdenum cofactor biosynthesis enzyme MoaA
VDERLVTTEYLSARLKIHLKQRLPAGTDVDSLDLTRSYAYNEMAIAFTNRCNLSCIYCIQSTQAKTNPYFTMDFPVEFAASTLDFFAAQGIDQVRSCVEGEATIYRHWYDVFSVFQKKYPHIALRMTTNLSRCYAEKEINLLAHYKTLDISCDTLDPKLFARLRRGGNLKRLLDNIAYVRAKAGELGIKGPLISLHAVVCDLTWPSLEELVDYAFANNMLVVLGNYEERANAVAFQKKICKPLTTIPQEEQAKAHQLILRVKKETEHLGYDTSEIIQGGILYNVERLVANNYNRFTPYNDNQLYVAFYARYPFGMRDLHLDIVYDYDNIAYSGILFCKQALALRLENLAVRHVVLREIFLYKADYCSTKYGQTVLPGYRKTVQIENGVFEYVSSFPLDVEKVLIEITDYW